MTPEEYFHVFSPDDLAQVQIIQAQIQWAMGITPEMLMTPLEREATQAVKDLLWEPQP